MARVTRADLDRKVEVINRRLGMTSIDDGMFIQYAYGKPRLVRAGGSIDVSNRLPAGEMNEFLLGMNAALDLVEQVSPWFEKAPRWARSDRG